MNRFALLTSVLLVAVFGGNATAEDKKTAYLTVISETGMPHSAVLMEYPGGKHVWLGFKPKVDKAPVSDGKLDDSDRTKEVDKCVRFEVDAGKLEEVEKAVRKEFDGKGYKVGVKDCVNLSAAFAKGLDMEVPDAPNFVPGKLVDNLKKLNEKRVQSSGNRKDALPWVKK